MTPVDRLRRVPPGRAGQIWLQHRLAVAERGAELLDEKLRILHGEAQRLALLTERTGAAWSAAHREAETWLLRAAVLVGERGLRLAAPPASTQVTLTWTHAMGATYPAEATLSFPTAPGTAVPAGSAALVAAARAYRRAADAAVQHAVAQAAAAIVAAEEAATRHRLRALTTHWIPRLSGVLADTQLALEEQEHADALRLRWAQHAGSAGGQDRGSR